MKTTVCCCHGCFNAALQGRHYCGRHIQYEARRQKGFRQSARTKSKEWHSLYNSRAWRSMSKNFLEEYPVCARCGRPAEIADHIIPHRGDKELFYNELNLQPLCRSCHGAKTMRENNFFKDRKRGMGCKNIF